MKYPKAKSAYLERSTQRKLPITFWMHLVGVFEPQVSAVTESPVELNGRPWIEWLAPDEVQLCSPTSCSMASQILRLQTSSTAESRPSMSRRALGSVPE